MEFVFLLLLFIIAFLYSSVGHGGASGYLALMALFGIAPVYMKSTSLTLNLFVAAIAFFAYARAGFFRFRLVLPFLLTSIPMAFAGAFIHVNPQVYEIILGILLLFAVARLLFVHHAVTENPGDPPIAIALLTGGILGFFSGMTGIGGGIILSPLLILFHWSTVKESAAASALFIFMNSLAGLSALFVRGFTYEPRMVIWIAAGLTGGIAGSYAGSMHLNQARLKYLLAAILIVASIKLFMF